MTDSRVVYLVAIIIAVAVGSFYYYSGKSHRLDSKNNSQVSSSAQGLQLLQTNERGQLAIKAQVGSIEQWAHQDKTVAQQIEGISYQNGQADLHFNAQHASSADNFNHVLLNGGVKVERFHPVSPVSFDTQSLTIDTKTKHISTNDQVLLHSHQSQLKSQGLYADLAKGDYQLFKIRGLYAPVQP